MRPHNWQSSENHTFLNPRFSAEQKSELLECLAPFLPDFKGHLFLLSSGTTAQSQQDLKWIALSKEAFLASAAAVNQQLQSSTSDTWLHPLPDFHVGGLSIWARSQLSGARIVPFGAWNVAAFIETVVREKITLTSLVPAQVFDLVHGGFQAPKPLRAILVGGGALAPELYQRARKLGWPLLPTYGMTETCSQVATAPLESLTTPNPKLPDLNILPHLELRLNRLNGDGVTTKIGDGVNQLLEIKGPSLLTAVIRRGPGGGPIQEDPKKEGWFQTQDRVLLKDRTLQVLGRVGDFIKIGGESVELGRLRDIFEKGKIRLSLGRNGDAAIIAVPDPRLGHVIHCIAETQILESDLSSLIEFYNSQVLSFEKIRKCHRLPALSRTPLGKLNSAACLQEISPSPSR